MLPLNYHHLYYFWATARAGSIGGASRRLHLAQPTLSLQLRQLEASVGRQLLERGRRGVRLTSDGEIAFRYCERIFSQGDELLAELRPDGRGGAPRLRLGIAGAVPRAAVLLVLGHLQPLGVRLSTSGGTAEELRRRLQGHRLDVLVTNFDAGPQLGVEFRSRKAGALPVHFVCAPRLARRVRYPTGLAGQPMLLRTPEHPVRKEVDLLLCRRGIEVSVDAELDDPELLLALALRGQGIAAIDSLTARDALATGRLTRLDRRPSGIEESIWLAAGRHPKPNPGLQKAIESLMTGFRLSAR